MKKTSIFFGFTALILAGTLFAPQTALAYKGDPNVKGPNYTEERHTAMLQAFENRNYNAWKALMDGKGAARRITAENFAKFAEAHQLALQGKTDEANKIRTELGLNLRNGTGAGQGMGYGRTNR